MPQIIHDPLLNAVAEDPSPTAWLDAETNTQAITQHVQRFVNAKTRKGSMRDRLAGYAVTLDPRIPQDILIRALEGLNLNYDENLALKFYEAKIPPAAICRILKPTLTEAAEDWLFPGFPKDQITKENLAETHANLPNYIRIAQNGHFNEIPKHLIDEDMLFPEWPIDWSTRSLLELLVEKGNVDQLPARFRNEEFFLRAPRPILMVGAKMPGEYITRQLLKQRDETTERTAMDHLLILVDDPTKFEEFHQHLDLVTPKGLNIYGSQMKYSPEWTWKIKVLLKHVPESTLLEAPPPESPGICAPFITQLGAKEWENLNPEEFGKYIEAAGSHQHTLLRHALHQMHSVKHLAYIKEEHLLLMNEGGTVAHQTPFDETTLKLLLESGALSKKVLFTPSRITEYKNGIPSPQMEGPTVLRCIFSNLRDVRLKPAAAMKLLSDLDAFADAAIRGIFKEAAHKSLDTDEERYGLFLWETLHRATRNGTDPYFAPVREALQKTESYAELLQVQKAREQLGENAGRHINTPCRD